jgi:anti-sigma-K factor RskA
VSTHPDLGELSGAYALNAVDAAERADYERRLVESETLRIERTGLADTAVLLGLAVAPEAPPAALRARILAEVARTPQLGGAAPAAPAVPSATLSADASAERRARVRWFTSPATLLVAAVAVGALLIGGGVLVNVVSQSSFEQAQADRLAAINAAGDAQRMAAEIEGGGTATLVWSSELASSVLMVDGLAPLPADRVYELWYIDESGARAAGTFTVGDTGSTWRVLDGEMGHGDTVGVTIEPMGGSPEPTTEPIVMLESA